jgi:hypothetical protein
MSYSHGSVTQIVPAAIAPDAIVGELAMSDFAKQHKEALIDRLVAHTDGGFADYGLEALFTHLSADSLRELIDTADNDSWRFTYHRGAQLKQIADDLQRVLDFIAAEPIAAHGLMDFESRYTEEDVRDAIASDLMTAHPGNDPRVKDAHHGREGRSPWYVFTCWRTLRAIYEEAWRDQAAVVRYLYVM